MNYAISALLNFSFKGRARRSEFWWYAVLVAMIAFAARLVSLHAGWVWEVSADPDLGLPAETIAYSDPIILVLTSYQRVALYARRLHDVNGSAWWLLLIVPAMIIGEVLFGSLGAVAGALPMLIVAFIPGTMGPNRFGEDPKASL